MLYRFIKNKYIEYSFSEIFPEKYIFCDTLIMETFFRVHIAYILNFTFTNEWNHNKILMFDSKYI